MHRKHWKFLPFLLVAACECGPRTSAPPDAGPIDAGPPPAPPKPVDVSALPKPEWDPASLAAPELKALDTYVAFSTDGTTLVSVSMSAGAGVPVATFIAATTNTVERTVALGSADDRRTLAQELVAAGFPRPADVKPVPPVLAATLEDGKVQLLFSGMPARAPVTLPAAEGTIRKASVAAVSADGKKVALRLDVQGTGEFGNATVLRVVPLFE